MPSRHLTFTTATFRRATRAVAILAALGTLGGCTSFDRWQREKALRPSVARAEDVPAWTRHARPGDERSFAALPDGSRIAIWWLPQADPCAPTALYLHGTFRHLYQNLPKLASLRDAGLAVLAVDYRGWGDSSPMLPSEASMIEDAHRALAELRRRAPGTAHLVVGHSLGGALAVRLAHEAQQRGEPVDGIVLESTFTTAADVADLATGLGWLARGLVTLEFDSAARIGALTSPILILHGDADTTVPVELGRRLHRLAPASTLRIVEGGSHSGLDREAPQTYRQAIAALLERLPARQDVRCQARPTQPPASTVDAGGDHRAPSDTAGR